jgi:hypothetical protein
MDKPSSRGPISALLVRSSVLVIASTLLVGGGGAHALASPAIRLGVGAHEDSPYREDTRPGQRLSAPIPSPLKRARPAHRVGKLWICPFSPNGHVDHSSCTLWIP